MANINLPSTKQSVAPCPSYYYQVQTVKCHLSINPDQDFAGGVYNCECTGIETFKIKVVSFP